MTQASPQDFRVLPHSIEAEICVIGAMVLAAPAIDAAREIVDGDDFYRPSHHLLFDVICRMADAGTAIDLVTLKEDLERSWSLDKIGGTENLVALVEAVPSSANVVYYAKIVKENSQRRAAIVAGNNMAQAGYDGESPSGIANIANDAAISLAASSESRNSNPASDVATNIQRAIDGQRVSIAWPWPHITEWARPCAPGCVTILCGQACSGKTFFFQDACLWWHAQGIPLAVMNLEKDRAYHLNRALAQLAGKGQLAHDEWQRQNPAEAMATAEAYRDVLNSYGRMVYDSPRQKTLDQVLEWIRARISDGARIVGVDPITAADAGKERWGADAKFMLACNDIASRAGCSIVLVTHPPKGTGKEVPSGDNLAGGAAYFRNSDCVLWLQGHNPPIETEINTVCGPALMMHNRTVHFCKTRDGTGIGLSLALNFDPATLQTSEVGPIRKKPKRRRGGE